MMKTRVSKLILSLNPFILRNPSIKPPLLPVFRICNWYGSGREGPTAGVSKDDDVFDDFFIRNLDFDVDEGGKVKGKMKKNNIKSDLNRVDGDRNEEKKPKDDPDGKEESGESSHDSEEIFKKMKETGLIPNTVAMLDGLCKDGLIKDAMKLFGSMREKGTIPEVVIYTAVMEGFFKAGNYEAAMRIFRKMQNNGITPNAFSYQVAIQGFSKGKKLVESVELCLEMLNTGNSPNVETFVTMVDAICQEKGIDGAQKAIATLREKDLVLDENSVEKYLDRNGPFSVLIRFAIFGRDSGRGNLRF